MEYSKIIAVTGMPGLYELLTSKSDGAIVRSLDDKTTKFVSSRIHNFSHLESIEVFTIRENVNLVEVFHAMEKATDKAPDGKDNSLLKKYFEKVYPDLDFDRVYSSDLKKMVKWFDVLKANEIEIKLSEPAPETSVDEEQEQEELAEEVAEVEVEKKTPAKKKAAPKAKAKDAEEEKPAKATKATKESKETKEAKPKKTAAKKKD